MVWLNRLLVGTLIALTATACAPVDVDDQAAVSDAQVAAEVPNTPTPGASALVEPTAAVPTPAPTALVPTPTSAPIPTQSPDAGPFDGLLVPDGTLLSDLPTWDVITADRPYMSVDELQQWGEADFVESGYSGTRFTNVDEGAFVDGAYQQEYPPGALTWRAEFAFDPVARYAWFGSDGVAEPGDGGCFEFLEVDDVRYLRSSIPDDELDPDGFVFTPQPDMDSAFDLAEDDSPVGVGLRFFDGVGVTPETTELAAGWTRYFSELYDDDITAAVDEFGGEGGINTAFDFGALEVIVDGRDQVRSLTLWARAIDDPRTFDSGDVRVGTEALYAHTAVVPLAANLVRRTSDMSLLESGFCRPPTAGIAGTWIWRSLIGGGSELTRSHLDQLNGAFIEIGDDGELSGSTGCRIFVGTSTIGFASLDDVDLQFSGERCVNEQFDEGTIEDLMVTILSSDMAATISLEERLFLVGSVEDQGIVLHFGRD